MITIDVVAEPNVRAEVAARSGGRALVIDYYAAKKLLRRVDGVGSLDEIFDRLIQAVEAEG